MVPFSTTKCILTTLAFLFFGVVHAQSYEIGGWAGAINYWGDINTVSSVFDAQPAGGFVGRYNPNSRLGVEVSASHGKVLNKDDQFDNVSDYQVVRNEAFRTSTLDISVAAEFNFWDFRSQTFPEDPFPFCPYLSAGVGFSTINPQIYLRGQRWIDAAKLDTEEEKKFSRGQVNIPLAAGVKWKLADKWNLTAEFASHLLFTDYFDDFSTTFNQFSVDNTTGGITTVNRQRGDRFKNDVYNLFGIQVTYVIPINNCP